MLEVASSRVREVLEGTGRTPLAVIRPERGLDELGERSEDRQMIGTGDGFIDV